MGEPRRTCCPAATDGSTGSYVVRRPSGCSMLTSGRPATIPANTTMPSPAASTGDTAAPARSAPRCPAANGSGGGSKGRVTASSPASGAHQRPTAAAGGAATAGEGASTAERTTSRGRRRARMRSTLGRERPGGRESGASVDGPTAGEKGSPASRMLSGAARSDGSTSRVLLPPTRGSRHLGPSGQPPGAWRRWTPGRRTTRCPRHNRGARPVAARRSERLQWQSSA
jgi:hypothetical protein